MPHFYFHVVNGEFMPDTVGLDCNSEAEVKTQAIVVAGEMLKEQGLKLWQTGHWDMYVCDDRQKTRLKLSFTAEELTGPSS